MVTLRSGSYNQINFVLSTGESIRRYDCCHIVIKRGACNTPSVHLYQSIGALNFVLMNYIVNQAYFFEKGLSNMHYVVEKCCIIIHMQVFTDFVDALNNLDGKLL